MGKSLRINGSRSEKTEFFVKIFLLLICVMATVPFIVAARYAVFHGDDFSFINNLRDMSGSTHLARCLQSTYHYYMTWQGIYLSTFVTSFFNPLYDYSYSYEVLRIFCMGGIVVTFALILLLSHQIDSAFRLGGKTLYIFALLLLPMLSFRDYADMYLWYVGEMTYMVPLCFLILGTSLLLQFKKDRRRLWFVLSGISLFLGVGGPLTIGGLAASYMLLFVVLDALRNKKIDKGFAALFAVVLIGDLINVAAPGNYARNSELGGLNVLDSLTSSFTIAFQEMGYLFGSRALLVFFVLAFIMGWRSKRKISGRILIPAVLGLLITPVITVFPYILGYGGPKIDLSHVDYVNRLMVVLDIPVVFGSECVAFLLAAKLAEVFGEKITKPVSGAALLLSLALICFVGVRDVNDSIPVQITKNLISGDIQAYSEDWHAIYDLMYTSPGEDIVLIEIPEACVGAKEVGFSARPDHAVNYSWANYFGNNSICTGYYISTYGEGEG